MKIKEIIDLYGRTLEIDDDQKAMISFDNKAKKIIYSSKIIENGAPCVFWTDFVEEGRVENVAEKVKSHSNFVKNTYAKFVDYNSKKNDPQQELFAETIKFVEKNNGVFFTKIGDFRRQNRKAVALLEEFLKNYQATTKIINKCNLCDLEQLTGIIPRDSWHKKRGGQVYFATKNGKTTAFLYLKDAKKFLKKES